MNRPKRPGCLSPLAILSVVATLAALAVIEFSSGSSMFSPGALNARAGVVLGGVASHAEIGAKCDQCHVPPWSAQRMADRCLSCHENIQAEAGEPSTLHGTLSQNAPLTCRDCHPEHRGAAAALTEVDMASYPHDGTGFALTGHKVRSGGIPFTCSDCHAERISAFSNQNCFDCHRSLDPVYTDLHLEDFGADCLACHDGQDRYADFDHSRTNFALAGAHQPLACSRCHSSARTIADLQSTTAACESCHQADDAHDGQFGAQCGTCHNPNSWQDASFDHSLAAFPLDGAHMQVACQDCHMNNVFKGTPRECAACHADPAYHAGMFAGQACSACHTTAAWRPAQFAGAHPFPLDHGEQTNTCADCHQPDLTQWTCYTCHDQAEMAREHQDEGITDFVDCLRCHPTGEEDEAEGKD